jgi:hypothetical protein
MPDDAYITNPDAQQGESQVRKGSRAPANIGGKVQPRISPDESVDEGPVPPPDHRGNPGNRAITDTPPRKV